MPPTRSPVTGRPDTRALAGRSSLRPLDRCPRARWCSSVDSRRVGTKWPCGARDRAVGTTFSRPQSFGNVNVWLIHKSTGIFGQVIHRRLRRDRALPRRRM